MAYLPSTGSELQLLACHSEDIVRHKECVHSTPLHASQRQHVQHNKYSILLHANFSPSCKISPSQTE